MAIRWYLLPLEVVDQGDGKTARGPKYFRWRFDPDPPGLNVPWGMMDYGLMPVAVLWADVTTQQHNALVANGDVRAVPTNLDATISAGQVANVRSTLEDLNIPGNWVTTADTWRGILRSTMGLFQFAQRLHAKFNVELVPEGMTLNTTWSEIPAQGKQFLLDTAQELGIDTSGATGSTTLRQIYKAFADAWGEQPFFVGGQEL